MDCKDKSIAHLIELPKIKDPRGNLTFIESGIHIPFQVKRNYWIYDVPSGMWRDGHAFKEQQEFLIALSGSFDVVVNDGQEEQVFHLARPQIGLYIPNLTWRHINNFSTNSVALVFTSTYYTQDDYIENYEDFIALKNGKSD